MSNPSQIPKWITAEIFESALRESVPGYKDVYSFNVKAALGPGENYVALALRVDFKVRLNDLSLASQSFFLKVSHNNDLYNNMFYKWNVFLKEHEVYRDFIPEFEQMFRDVGVDVHFGPKAYNMPVKHEYLLLEDLARRGFKNANRQYGLDLHHCQAVLKKLAQWHAASAVRVERKGPYDDIYLNGSINPQGRPLIEAMMNAAIKNILRVSKDLKNSDIYYEQLSKLKDTFPQFLLDHIEYDPNEFNVLNHGDFWCNNIMFQYDDRNKLKEAYMIDFQLVRYASPGQDLVYFMWTSAQYHLKVARFDELIKYYHGQLIENLKLLKYSKQMPSLGDIHKSVVEARAYSTFSAFTIMPAALAEPVESASLEDLVGDSAESTKLKEQVLRQDKIRNHLELILPFMYYKGHFEYK